MPYTIDLTGKNALVTGGTRGIGRAISLRLAQAGARIGAIYRSNTEAAQEALRLLAETNPADHFVIQADIGDETQAVQATEEALRRLDGALDLLILDAAAGASGQAAGMSTGDWKRPFDVNVHGHFYVARAAFSAMRKGSSVVFISSGAGHDPIAGLSAYGISKAAVNHMAAVLAQEWGPGGIRVNVVSPGHTAMRPVDYDHLTDHQQETVNATALRRLGTPDDVANAVLFFASDLSGFVTGQAIRVNGGRV